MRLLYAVILIAGFGLPAWWYALSVVIWIGALLWGWNNRLDKEKPEHDIFNRAIPIYRPPQVVTPRMIEAGLPVLEKHRGSSPEETLRAVYESMFAKQSW